MKDGGWHLLWPYIHYKKRVDVVDDANLKHTATCVLKMAQAGDSKAERADYRLAALTGIRLNCDYHTSTSSNHISISSSFMVEIVEWCRHLSRFETPGCSAV